MRKIRGLFVKDGNLHLALREWRAQMTAPVTLAVLFGVALVLGIVVPFDTDETLGPIARFPYWMAIVGVTYGAGALINDVMSKLWRGRMPLWRLILLSCLATGIAISAIVTVINYFTFQYWPDLVDLPAYIGSIFAIAFIVAGIFQIVTKQRASTAAVPPPVLERLPYEKRGQLVALSVEDHYVRILTTKGADVVLLRLRDAMLETGDVAGLQVHRSHWVALDAVTSARRDGDRAILTLQTGDDIPVSRRYVGDIKQAGLLAK